VRLTFPVTNPTVVVLKLGLRWFEDNFSDRLNPTVVVLKLTLRQTPSVLLASSQSNRSGFETIANRGGAASERGSQSNRSGFETSIQDSLPFLRIFVSIQP